MNSWAGIFLRVLYVFLRWLSTSPLHVDKVTPPFLWGSVHDARLWKAARLASVRKCFRRHQLFRFDVDRNDDISHAENNVVLWSVFLSLPPDMARKDDANSTHQDHPVPESHWPGLSLGATVRS